MKRKNNYHKGVASLDSLRKGFDRFYNENGRYPKAVEIDNCKYLCSSRHIQRTYGGLRRLRKLLSLDIIDYGSGTYRQQIGIRCNRLSIETENAVKRFLIDKYGEIFVHEEMKTGEAKHRVDFFIYAKTNFAVDVFNTYTLSNLNINLNIKIPKYREFPHKLYYIVTGANFKQYEIDKLLSKKLNKLSINMKCLTFEAFKRECVENLPALRTKLKYYSRMQPDLL